tara:strand:+ start:1262 stop:2224 length:963 start_codon:yes stop_codon:yes gene_type:complete
MKIYNDKIIFFRETLDQKLKNIYTTGPDSLKYPINHVLSGSGKRFRPILALIIADMNGVSLEQALPSALSIEILHNFTLVHDDIMDKDVLRHGIETVHEKWDINTAILSGDAMLAISLKLLMNSSLPNRQKLIDVFVQGLLSVCEGQAIDIEFENQNDVTLDSYKNMIYLKTAYMIGLSAQMGAIVSNLSDKKVLQLKEFGDCIGMAYQVQDDLLELFSDSKAMKKSLDSDFVLNKKTFLWVATKDELKDELNEILSNFKKNKDSTISNLRNFVINNGIKEKAEKFIEYNIDRSRKIIDTLDGDSSFLNYFSDLVLNREY